MCTACDPLKMMVFRGEGFCVAAAAVRAPIETSSGQLFSGGLCSGVPTLIVNDIFWERDFLLWFLWSEDESICQFVRGWTADLDQ